MTALELFKTILSITEHIKSIIGTRKNRKNQVLFSVMSRLQAADMQEARKAVLEALPLISQMIEDDEDRGEFKPHFGQSPLFAPVADWPKRDMAFILCDYYDTLGLSIQNEEIDTKRVFQAYGNEIVSSYRVLQKYIELQRKNVCPDFGKNFQLMAAEIRDNLH